MTEEINPEAMLEAEIADLADEIAGLGKEQKEERFAEAQLRLRAIVAEYKEIKAKTEAILSTLAPLNTKMHELESEARRLWTPFVIGSDKAELKFECGKLSGKQVVTPKMEDEEASTAWLGANGYKDVMKWQIHNQTFKKIAKEEYDKGVQIPGTVYKYFFAVTIK